MMKPTLLVLLICLAQTFAEGPSEYGPYEVQDETWEIGGLITGGSQQAYLVYPQGPGPFPFIAFAHGMTAGGARLRMAYQRSLRKLASHGFVIAAPMSCPQTFCANFVEDQLHAIDAAKQAAATGDARFTKVDFNNVGIAGHSMGGFSSVRAASGNPESRNIKAAIALHPGRTFPSNPKIPIFFTSGTADTITPPGGTVSMYRSTRAAGKVLAVMVGATHMEPNQRTSRWDPYVAAFFKYHLYGDQSQKHLIYSTDSGSLCTAYIFQECEYTEPPTVSGDVPRALPTPPKTDYGNLTPEQIAWLSQMPNAWQSGQDEGNKIPSVVNPNQGGGNGGGNSGGSGGGYKGGYSGGFGGYGGGNGGFGGNFDWSSDQGKKIIQWYKQNKGKGGYGGGFGGYGGGDGGYGGGNGGYGGGNGGGWQPGQGQGDDDVFYGTKTPSS